jgi:hypothetical protein
LLFGLAVLVLTACGCGAGGGSGTTNGPRAGTAARSQTPETTEYKLAVVDAGTYVKPEDIVVARFRSLLSQLSTRWRETPTRIADMSVAAKQQLRKVGIDQQILGFMEGMNLITPVAGKGFPEYTSLYIVMRNQGRSHEVAIAALKIASASDFPAVKNRGLAVSRA